MTTKISNSGFHFGTGGRRDALNIIRSNEGKVFEIAGHNDISNQEERIVCDTYAAICYVKDFPGDSFTVSII
jgi:hypothetical protein